MVVKVKSPGELKDKIYGDEALQESFKSYLVREFCVSTLFDPVTLISAFSFLDQSSHFVL